MSKLSRPPLPRPKQVTWCSLHCTPWTRHKPSNVSSTFFPAYLHQQIRMELSLGLQGIICQRLLPRKDNQGRIPSIEVMVNTPYIRKLLHDGKTLSLLPQIEDGGHWQMQSFNQSLFDLIEQKLITYDTAMKLRLKPRRTQTNGRRHPHRHQKTIPLIIDHNACAFSATVEIVT